MRNRIAAMGAGLLVALTPVSAQAITQSPDSAAPVPVQLLSITDLHGYFGDYTTTVPGSRAGQPAQTVGGGAYLATHIDQLKEGKDNSLLFSVGDDFSGWPDNTEWFWNEPTIEYLNYLGLDFSTVGNHELDRNFAYLQHMMEGTCAGRPDDDLCFTDSTGEVFKGADFEYFSGNIIDEATGEPALPPYHVQYVDDGAGGTMPIGFVHATIQGALSEGMSYTPRGYHAEDEADAVNKYAAELQAQGVQAIVAVIHEGFTQQSGSGYNDCRNPSGPVVDDFNKRITADVDAIVTGHWHGTVNCMLEDPEGAPRPIVQAGNHGRLISEINLFLDPVTGEVIRDRTVSTVHANTQDVAPDPGALSIARYWDARAAERGITQVAEVTADIPRSPDNSAESPLGNLTADAFLAAARTDGEADLGLVTPGIVLRDIRYAPSGTSDAPGRVMFSELVTGTLVDSGIGHGVVRGNLTGREIDLLLENQWQMAENGSVTYTHLAVSGNLSYRFNPDKPVGNRINPGDVRIDGKPLVPNRTYRVASTSGAFLLPAASPFALLREAADQDRSVYNANDALWHYMADRSPVAPPATDRSRPKR